MPRYNENSWFIVSNETGKAVAEVYSIALLDRLNLRQYKAVRPSDYLAGLRDMPKGGQNF